MTNFMFGPHIREVWPEVAQELGGTYHEGGHWQRALLITQYREWQLVLDSYLSSPESGNSTASSHYTRLRVPFLNPHDFRLKITEATLTAKLWSMIGGGRINMGVREFDEKFIVRSKRPGDVKLLLGQEVIHEGLVKVNPHRVEVDEERGFFRSKFPAGVTQLKFTFRGVMRNPERIRNLFVLARLMLERMAEHNLISSESPGIDLREF